MVARFLVMMRSSLLVILTILAFGATASAGQHVDWSQYIETNPSKPVTSKSVTPAPTRTAKATRHKAKAKATRHKAKKAKARARARRRH
jgi:hypothetical protein